MGVRFPSPALIEGPARAGPSSFLRALAQLLRDLLVPLVALALGRAAVLDPLELALELAPRRQPVRVDLVADRAARLGAVLAVDEAAVRRERVDVGEGLAGAVPQAGHADAGRVDQLRAARQRQQLAGDRGVAAAPVGRAN